jgi:phage terminase large subunit-like protein
MDTDGYCSKDGSVCFSSISPRLINGVAHIVQSLGGVVRYRKPYYAAYKNSEGNRVKCQKSYAISINLPPSIKPFALTRKLARYKPRLKYLPSRGIVNIEYVGKKHMRCIETSDPSHLYLTNNFIVTHNSTWLCQWIAWIIGTHVNIGIALKIVFVSYVIDVAAAKSRQIKSILESPAYQEVFPLVRPGKIKWGEREWQIDLDLAGIRTIDEPYTLVCSGLGGAIISKRANIILFDDLIKQMSDAVNKSIQDRMVDNYNNGIKYIRFPESRVINLGTRFAKYDIYNRIFVAPYYKVLKQSALLVNQYGEEYSFWEPDTLGSSFGYPLALLQEERERNYESFLLQRQNEIPQESVDGIREEHIHYGWMPAQFDQLLIGVDLAGSVEKYSDCTAYCVIGIREDVVYICDAWEEKIQGNLQKITKLYHYWEKWHSRCRGTATIAVDANKYSSLFRQDLEYYLDNLDKLKIEIPNVDYDFAHIFIKDVASAGRGKEKIDRLNSHSGLFENGKVVFNLISEPELPSGQTPIKKLVEEIIDFNSNESNDLMDSMEVAIYEGRQYIGNELSSA